MSDETEPSQPSVRITHAALALRSKSSLSLSLGSDIAALVERVKRVYPVVVDGGRG